jgi:hypothetical protein
VKLVSFERKLEEPVAPNRLPEAPDPKAAPISAPFPCCRRTKPITASANNIWKRKIVLNNIFI